MTGVLEAAELHGLLDGLEALCVHGLEAANKRVMEGMVQCLIVILCLPTVVVIFSEP